jgi:hypothetical protein
MPRLRVGFVFELRITQAESVLSLTICGQIVDENLGQVCNYGSSAEGFADDFVRSAMIRLRERKKTIASDENCLVAHGTEAG